MASPPSLDFKLALFIEQIKECPKLKTEWDNYYKAKPDSEIRCLEYLYNSALLVVERERFEAARSKVAGKGCQDVMRAPGESKGKWKGKGKGKGVRTNADGTPWYMEDGQDVRAKQACRFLAAGHCKMGATCPWNHKMDSGTTVDSDAATSGKGPHNPNHPSRR
eukprot:12372091-Heterocapsa_arctica.AAC.1